MIRQICLGKDVDRVIVSIAFPDQSERQIHHKNMSPKFTAALWTCSIPKHIYKVHNSPKDMFTTKTHLQNSRAVRRMYSLQNMFAKSTAPRRTCSLPNHICKNPDQSEGHVGPTRPFWQSIDQITLLIEIQWTDSSMYVFSCGRIVYLCDSNIGSY